MTGSASMTAVFAATSSAERLERLPRSAPRRDSKSSSAAPSSAMARVDRITRSAERRATEPDARRSERTGLDASAARLGAMTRWEAMTCMFS